PRPKNRKPQQKAREKRLKRATSSKRLAIQDRKLQRTVDQVKLHSAKPHASGAYLKNKMKGLIQCVRMERSL
ncbi:hypothetical protein ACQWFR_25225, partial [Salmonella enterica subsp. enterica serovar Infantis]